MAGSEIISSQASNKDIADQLKAEILQRLGELTKGWGEERLDIVVDAQLRRRHLILVGLAGYYLMSFDQPKADELLKLLSEGFAIRVKVIRARWTRWVNTVEVVEVLDVPPTIGFFEANYVGSSARLRVIDPGQLRLEIGESMWLPLDSVNTFRLLEGGRPKLIAACPAQIHDSGGVKRCMGLWWLAKEGGDGRRCQG